MVKLTINFQDGSRRVILAASEDAAIKAAGEGVTICHGGMVSAYCVPMRMTPPPCQSDEHDWVEDTTGSRSYSGGDVDDDIKTRIVCAKCGVEMPEPFPDRKEFDEQEYEIPF